MIQFELFDTWSAVSGGRRARACVTLSNPVGRGGLVPARDESCSFRPVH